LKASIQETDDSGLSSWFRKNDFEGGITLDFAHFDFRRKYTLAHRFCERAMTPDIKCTDCQRIVRLVYIVHVV
jgi:hypothetical protein